jgi:uncharacterized cysteine cluster protein YcgN (CxxCxxCC family)
MSDCEGESIVTRAADWEAKCRRCARCCYEKIDYEGTIYYTDIPCEKLDPESRRCTVYAEREKLRPGCVQLTPEIVGRGFLPADCPYVADICNYRPPVLYDEEDK